jgi:ribonuclease G
VIDTVAFNVAVNVAPGETRVALLAGERTLEVFHHRTGRENVVGNVYLGRVTRVVPALRAAFVDIGLERAGFLDAADARRERDGAVGPIGSFVHEGEAVLVQAICDPVGDKGARLRLRPTLPGRRLAYAPDGRRITLSRRIGGRDERARLAGIVGDLAAGDDGFVVRTAAAGASAADLAREAARLRDQWAGIQERRRAASAPACVHRELEPVTRVLRDYADARLGRVVIDSPTMLAEARRFCARHVPELEPMVERYREDEAIFERFGVEAALDAALEPRGALPSGGEVVIEHTEAVCAIDVDTRGCAGSDGTATRLRTNLEAAAEIARQLRLRAIGGLIVIDFAHMRRKDHGRRVLDALREALADDREAGLPRGFSRLGLVEMTRRRTRPPLAEVLGDPWPGLGRRKSATTVALAIARAMAREARSAPPGPLTVVAAPEVAAVLAAPETGALAALAESLGRAIEVRAEADCEREAHDIIVG